MGCIEFENLYTFQKINKTYLYQKKMNANFQTYKGRSARYFDKDNRNNYFLKLRSSHWKCCIKKAVFKNLAIFIEKNMCWSLSSIKLQICRLVILLKTNSIRFFPANILKFLNRIRKWLLLMAQRTS